MIRDIKYRAKNNKGKWLYGFVALVSHYENLHVWRMFNFETGTEGTPIDPKTIGQYTGEKYDTGADICEGDIICYVDGVMHTGIIKYEACRFFIDWEEDCFFTDDLMLFAPRISCLGNVHDNPELMENKK